MKMPPGTLRSRSFTRFTMRVGLPHLGQSVLLVVSIIFLRSAVLATLAMVLIFSCQGKLRIRREPLKRSSSLQSHQQQALFYTKLQRWTVTAGSGDNQYRAIHNYEGHDEKTSACSFCGVLAQRFCRV